MSCFVSCVLNWIFLQSDRNIHESVNGFPWPTFNWIARRSKVNLWCGYFALVIPIEFNFFSFFSMEFKETNRFQILLYFPRLLLNVRYRRFNFVSICDEINGLLLIKLYGLFILDETANYIWSANSPAKGTTKGYRVPIFKTSPVISRNEYRPRLRDYRSNNYFHALLRLLLSRIIYKFGAQYEWIIQILSPSCFPFSDLYCIPGGRNENGIPLLYKFRFVYNNCSLIFAISRVSSVSINPLINPLLF